MLKKQKDNTCAKALKSLAFLRMGKTEESKELVAEILKEVPSDEPTLQAMSICLREMSRGEKSSLSSSQSVLLALPIERAGARIALSF